MIDRYHEAIQDLLDTIKEKERDKMHLVAEKAQVL